MIGTFFSKNVEKRKKFPHLAHYRNKKLGKTRKKSKTVKKPTFFDRPRFRILQNGALFWFNMGQRPDSGPIWPKYESDICQIPAHFARFRPHFGQIPASYFGPALSNPNTNQILARFRRIWTDSGLILARFRLYFGPILPDSGLHLASCRPYLSVIVYYFVAPR